MPGIVVVVAYVGSDMFTVQTAKDIGPVARSIRIGRKAPESMPKTKIGRIGIGPLDSNEVELHGTISKTRIGNSRHTAVRVLVAKDVAMEKARARASKTKRRPHHSRPPTILLGRHRKHLSVSLRLLRA